MLEHTDCFGKQGLSWILSLFLLGLSRWGLLLITSLMGGHSGLVSSSQSWQIQCFQSVSETLMICVFCSSPVGIYGILYIEGSPYLAQGLA